MKKSVPWNLIIPKLKQEISADAERQLETWLRSSNNEALFKELKLLWEKIQANVENYTPNTEYYWNEPVSYTHLDVYKRQPLDAFQICSGRKAANRVPEQMEKYG